MDSLGAKTISSLYEKAQLQVWQQKRVQEVADKLLGRETEEVVDSSDDLPSGTPAAVHWSRHKGHHGHKGHKKHKKGFR